MELDFRDYCEGWTGGLLGAGAGYLAGGPLGAAFGGWAGHKIQNYYSGKQHPFQNPNFFVYYRDADGRVVKELLPNAYIPLGEEWERLNADKTHPYYYFNKCAKQGEGGQCEQVKMVKKIKSGYQNYQRRVRYGSNPYQQPRQQRRSR